MTTPEHSPLPWRLYRANSANHILGGDGMPVITATPLPIRRGPKTNEGTKRYSTNARLIVRAVNAHDALLAAAKAFVDAGDALGQHGTPVHLQAHYDAFAKAIAAAEELAP
jgi:hypothetical protein